MFMQMADMVERNMRAIQQGQVGGGVAAAMQVCVSWDAPHCSKNPVEIVFSRIPAGHEEIALVVKRVPYW
jgi:membrane protease subunit (stomatin/prohibitin family)